MIYNNITQEEVIGELKRINEYADNFHNTAFADLCLRLKKLQRTRHLCIWHNGSSIANHGHLMIMVNVIYDPAIFYTDDEYLSRFREKANIQREVEKPVMYLLARCPTDDSQLMYSNTRMEDMIDLSNSLTVRDDINIYGKCRFFKGNGPACQHEAGQQKAGRFFAGPVLLILLGELILLIHRTHQ